MCIYDLDDLAIAPGHVAIQAHAEQVYNVLVRNISARMLGLPIEETSRLAAKARLSNYSYIIYHI